jgi:phosphoribosylformylglycinamidine synthase
MKSSVITFPGSNCDRDMDVALNKFGFKNKMVWHNDNELPKSDLVVLPGGFSYGDYLRCGSMASKSKIMQSVLNFAKSGGMVMGVCNGFQILVETGLVPGVLLRNKYLEFICKNVFVKLENKKNTYFKNINKDILELHVAHNEGNYFCTNDQLKEIQDNNQIALYYCNNKGQTEDQYNPNGSTNNIAGILIKKKMF